MISNHKA